MSEAEKTSKPGFFKSVKSEFKKCTWPKKEDLVKNGEKKQVQKKMFPAYVLINMIMNDQTWYVVRNTRGVTGFVGPGSKPVPLTEEEIANMGFLAEAEASPFSIGDHVIVTEGVWQDTDGVVQEVHPAKQMAVIVIDMFGRDTPVEIDFSELKLV